MSEPVDRFDGAMREYRRRLLREIVRDLDGLMTANPRDAEAADALIKESGAEPPSRGSGA